MFDPRDVEFFESRNQIGREKQTSTWEWWYPGKKKLEERCERDRKLNRDLRTKSRKLQELNGESSKLIDQQNIAYSNIDLGRGAYGIVRKGTLFGDIDVALKVPAAGKSLNNERSINEEMSHRARTVPYLGHKPSGL